MVMLSLVLVRLSRQSFVYLSELANSAYRLYRTRQDLARLDKRTMEDIGLIPLDNDHCWEKSLWDRS